MNLNRIAAALTIVAAVASARPSAAQQPGGAPAPQDYTIQTRDGVQLALTYYAAPHGADSAEAKQATPVVLLHDHKETRAVFNSLVARLQAPREEENAPTFAVVTVDLRGHGASTKQFLPNGLQRELDSARQSRDDLVAMAALDMEAVRSFLVGKNDDGELNLNKLALVGAGMGASIAITWAADDWAAPPLAIGKQGQDVKALALISPRWSYQGLNLVVPMRLRPLKEQASWLLIYGDEDSRVAADSRRIYNQLLRFHPESADAANAQPSGLTALGWASSLQGGSLLSRVGAPIEERIVQFLTERVARHQYPWIARRDRLP